MKINMVSSKPAKAGQTGGIPRQWTDTLRAVFRTALAMSLLSFYLLPNTVWATLSPGMIATRLTATTQYSVDYLLVGLFGVAAPLAFFLKQSRGEQRVPPSVRPAVPAWLPIAGYFAPMVSTLCLYRDYPLLAAGVAAMLAAFATGITAAMVAGTTRRAVIALLVVTFVQGLYTLSYQNRGINKFVSGDIARAGGTFNDPNGVYILMLLALPLAFAVRSEHATLRLLCMLATSVMLAALLVTWCRGGMLGLTACLVWLAFRLYSGAKLRILIVVAAVVLFGAVSLYRSSGPVNSASASRSNSGRTMLWRKGLVIFEKNWLTGTGVGALAIPTQTPTRDPNRMVVEVQSEPKNLIIDWLDELGVSGGVLLILFIVVLHSRLRAAGGTDEALGVGAAWLGLLVAGMFDTPFGAPFRYHGNAFVGCLFGATCLLATRRSADQNGARSRAESVAEAGAW